MLYKSILVRRNVLIFLALNKFIYLATTSTLEKVTQQYNTEQHWHIQSS